MSTRLAAGDDIIARRLDTIDGASVQVPDPGRLVHLQFRRFAGCPICHLHLRSLSRRYDEIVAARVSEVAVFHSTAESLRQYQSDLPFAVVADPEKALYRQFGVEASLASVLHPRAWWAAARGVAQQRSLRAGMGPGEEHLGRPADFLISPQGVLLAAKYGAHADDQWSVDEIIALAARFGAGS
ncbi:MAG: AhpC/TSA family protein [Mycobacterium sp.]|uniref:peroxiredoxin-like family protein n=1 Tax=uncultured Mycolicibacterium sp. TaxID=2320817 RepID=UPI0032B1E89C|nr:AhpC/TSA family protein [Mycobacterium sp.]